MSERRPVNETLCRSLVVMVEQERTARERLAASGELFRGYAEEMERVHIAHARRLEAIVEEHGWPGRSLVGDDGAEAAWILAQHAISLPRFQRRCLDLIGEAVRRSEAPARHEAALTDRVRFNQRRPQVFGTIMDWDRDRRLSPWPIESPEGVDERRRKAGLPPLEETVRRLREEAGREGEQPPDDYERRQAEIRSWAARVGWIDERGERKDG